MKWKLALSQHPMYLLIREDTQCAERTPPWGAPDIETYLDRVRQNIQALERYPRLKLGYEWSGVELELLAQDAPEVLAQMRTYAREGRIQFYNGTYAQPHLQVLSAESNLRQLDYGARVYREAGLPAVKTYAHQEASVHDQVPQLLRAFGFQHAVTPGFLSTLAWLDEGELVLHGVRGPRFVQGHEFVQWEGLDGTAIPLYLHQPAPREYSLEETLVKEAVLGRLSSPTLLVDMPDMIDINEAWMAERKHVTFALLDEELADRMNQAPPSGRARLYTHWSYLEGIRAEELSRRSLEAEQAVLRYEALDTLAHVLLERTGAPSDDLWKTILALQHHDVYCFSAPELRDKAISRLKEAQFQANQQLKRAAAAIAEQVDTRGPADRCLVIFNTTPHPQTGPASLETTGEHLRVMDAMGSTLPGEALPAGPGRTRLRFWVDLPGFGYTTLWLGEGKDLPPAERATGPLTFENAFYRATVMPDGTFLSLAVKPGGDELLSGEAARANRLSATDSAAISLRPDSPVDRLERYLANPPVRGPALTWEPEGPARLQHSPLGLTLTVEGRVGPRVQAILTIEFHHRQARIDLTWRFTCDHASIGTFFDDDSKLLVHWPLGFSGQITQDIPFGSVEARRERPLFPTRWVDISDEKKGFTMVHLGTPHFWVSGNTLVNLIAWGEETDAIHNGLGRHQWLKSFDQRLDGTHMIRYALVPHPGKCQPAEADSQARSFHFPPVAISTSRHTGSLPPSCCLLALEDRALSATAVFTRDEQVVCRVYAASGKTAAGGPRYRGLLYTGFYRLPGERVEELGPFQIGEMIFLKNGHPIRKDDPWSGSEKDGRT